MAKPQQPEVARSGRTPVDPDHIKDEIGGMERRAPAGKRGFGPVPEDNQPGHRPDADQDKPLQPPRPGRRAARRPAQPKGAAKGSAEGPLRFAFLFEPRVMPFSFAVGVTPWTTRLDIAGGELRVRFGPWSLTTPLTNVADATLTGPYSLTKVAGPPRLSLADRGVTFATTRAAGVCIRFREPVRGALPFGLLRHPAATVTVAEPRALIEALTREQD